MIDPKSQIVIIYLYPTMAPTLIGKWSRSQGQYGHMEECHWLAPKSKVRGSHSHRTQTKRRGLRPRYQNQIRGSRSEATWRGAHVVRSRHACPRFAAVSWGSCGVRSVLEKRLGGRPRPYPIHPKNQEPLFFGSHHIKNVLDVSSKHLPLTFPFLFPLSSFTFLASLISTNKNKLIY